MTNFAKVKRQRSDATFTFHEPTFLIQGEVPANPELYRMQYAITDVLQYSLLTARSPRSSQITIISAPRYHQAKLKIRPIKPEATVKKLVISVCETMLPVNGKSCAVMFLRMLIFHR